MISKEIISTFCMRIAIPEDQGENDHFPLHYDRNEAANTAI